jgi:3-phenylpropionate/trans-cinnamate dioxygenase ferredoxin subunit
MSGFHRVCSIFDLDEGKVLAAEVEGEPVAVACSQDSVFAIRDVCSHASVPLSEGAVEDCAIECWLHGSRFDLRTGEPLGPPATKWVPVYAVAIEGEDVLVAIKDPYCAGLTARSYSARRSHRRRNLKEETCRTGS